MMSGSGVAMLVGRGCFLDLMLLLWRRLSECLLGVEELECAVFSYLWLCIDIMIITSI